MTPEELRAIMDYLRGRVYVASGGAEGEVTIEFE